MRLGIFGGTFDPVHYGHLLLAECCREQLALDRVWFLPAAVPPHKQGRDLTDGKQRVEMLELAIGGHPAFEVCRHEIERGGVNYTVDTLEHLHAEDPARVLFFLMGADSLRDLPSWKEPARICQLATPVVAARELKKGMSPLGKGAHPLFPGSTGAAGDVLDFSGLEHLLPPERIAAIRSHQVVMPTIDLSASDIRSCVAEGRSIRYRTPRAVEKYIEAKRLYR